MTEYTCYDCSGAVGELQIWETDVDHVEHCPFCGRHHTVETVEEYRERHNV